jgi:hypothetical protein
MGVRPAGVSVSGRGPPLGHNELVRLLVSFLLLILALAAAAEIRNRSQSGVLGRRQAYGRPMSDWAGLTAFGVGAGFAALVAGVRWLAWLLIAAVLAQSWITLRAVRPKRRR